MRLGVAYTGRLRPWLVANIHDSVMVESCFQEDQGHGQTLAGEPLGLRGAVIILKGDWAEHSHTMGMSAWASTS